MWFTKLRAWQLPWDPHRHTRVRTTPPQRQAESPSGNDVFVVGQAVMHQEGTGVSPWSPRNHCPAGPHIPETALLPALHGQGAHSIYTLNASARADLLWWKTFLKDWNGASFFPATTPSIEVVSDVSVVVPFLFPMAGMAGKMARGEQRSWPQWWWQRPFGAPIGGSVACVLGQTTWQ